MFGVRPNLMELLLFLTDRFFRDAQETRHNLIQKAESIRLPNF